MEVRMEGRGQVHGLIGKMQGGWEPATGRRETGWGKVSAWLRVYQGLGRLHGKQPRMWG